MTAENLPGEEPGPAGDDTDTRDQLPQATSLAPHPDPVEPKGYPDIAVRESAAPREESVSGEEEDFLSG
ncbi:hypothetical protein J2W15_004186 [Pseudarthrobacter sulfonivorans]|nr:hypothetical protein [Pseudarthrobacter sulfonivorans]